MNKLADLELLSWEEHRGVLPEYGPDGSVSSLVPSRNVVVMLHVRAPGGDPFTVTTDEDTFHEKLLPLLRPPSPDG